MTQAAALYEQPIGQIIRKKRKSHRWSIRDLLDQYVSLLIKYDRARAEEVHLYDDSLMLTETDIARYERGDPVRMPIPKLRLLCIALKFTQEEIVRILARVQHALSADGRDESSNLISLATVTMRENAHIKEFIRQRIGPLVIEDIPTDEALRIIRAAITEYLDHGALLALPAPTSAEDAVSPKPPAPSAAARSATTTRKKTSGSRRTNTDRPKKTTKRG